MSWAIGLELPEEEAVDPYSDEVWLEEMAAMLIVSGDYGVILLLNLVVDIQDRPYVSVGAGGDFND